ncbi:MAG: outer membrane protein OmpA-like peptidoglycan-associated protein [Pseudoalteromonas rhizosphaerae]|jgi:outer membrane protein OmpA-like peptidoglycan-associated protein|uniref:OmpA family protein n=1 Tax=Pseudoalteromonas neustonica TaxID=1840331 RepID=A0ABY3F8G7_9GAMM|nr:MULTISPECIES: OmpA family protein [Pseudoalteromonas]MBB1506913.1 OmpA family protein [Pseudoalteromonas sp. SG41-1]TVU80351.1 OmpA family protein [Pseudoalteromonas neustonica]
MTLTKPLLTATIVGLLLTGCETTNTGMGAGIGAATGAVLGKATGDHDDKRIFIGAAIGALAGAAVGDYMDKQEAAFRDELAGSGVEVVREGDNLRLVMPANITFSTDQSYISSGFHNTLDAIAKVMNKYEKTYLSIEGHTDSTGKDSYNMTLSQQRAQSVKGYLVNQQILAGRISTRGYGETRPIASNDSANGRAQNRRVEVQIVPNTKG